ncbi:F0F1 ATP synthase subunit B [Membranihabitans maritimus]|uniref:F0F1 ATP synthase subunit B n=1 Tax=Membranihabitans maritimus TaxID=2904244 RepID=UPI001F02DC8B|nr:F0F1 ATP synthase subunit B [Membranihabitans maritimus]
MLVLAEFNVLRPDPGLLFWSVLIFLIFWFLMAKFAFKPITNALIKRENHIQDALNDARKAKEELRRIQTENEKLLDEARQERAQLLKDAKDQGSKIVEEAKSKAKEEAGKILTQAKEEIENQKKAALHDVKNQVTTLALNVAEQVVRKNLSDQEGQVQLVKGLVDDINLS